MIFKPTGKARRPTSTISVPGAAAARDATAVRDATEAVEVEVEAVEVDAVEADAVEADARRETTRAVGNPQPKRISLFTQLKPDRSDISQGRFFLACRGLTPPPAL